jgi:hypothetical protein
MGPVNSVHPFASITAVLGATLIGATLLSPLAVNVARAQSEPVTAANGVVLPSPYDDPAAARIEDLAESAALTTASTTPVPPTEESAATDAPEATAETPDAGTDAPDPATDAPDAVTSAPEAGNSVTTVLGGSDVAVSSVGGSYEVDRPNKRSERKK